jgi:hypothetical protein
MTETRDKMPDGLSNSISSFLKRTDHLRDFNRSTSYLIFVMDSMILELM